MGRGNFVNQGRPTETAALLMTLTNAIKEGFSYERRTDKGTQSPVYTLASAAWLLPRFRDADDGSRAGARASPRASSPAISMCPSRDTGEGYLGGGSTHAWCQIYLPGAGWVEFDPTNGIVGNRDLIRVAVARDARQAIPLHGIVFRQRRGP